VRRFDHAVWRINWSSFSITRMCRLLNG